ncbi:hypothetical protein [Selenomonas noxia]
MELNELGRIFDKKKIEEQQELVPVFGEKTFQQTAKKSLSKKSKIRCSLRRLALFLGERNRSYAWGLTLIGEEN